MSSDTSARPWRRRAVRIPLIGAFALIGASGAAVLGAQMAAAAVPAFPDNIVIFPNRDFITVEGFQDHVGETALVEVSRPGVGVVGSARATVAAGDVAFEINHPGGYCWGAGTDLQITPDILPGDKATLAFPDGTEADTTTQHGYVTDVNYTTGSTTLTVVGHVGDGIDPANLEQRIVNPGTDRHRGGPARRARRPRSAHPRTEGRVQLRPLGERGNLTATYEFDDAAVAEIAATGGGERLLSWQVTDADGNRQGITIAELGELGGPGFGGCPNGPLQAGPPGPTDVSAAVVSGDLKLTWTPAVAVPGTPPITGYRATAIAPADSTNERVEIGRRITGVSDTGTTISGLSGNAANYDVEVVSVSSVGQTWPPVTVHPVTDTTPPVVTADPAAGSFPVAQNVRLSADQNGSEIYFTTNGDDPFVNDTLATSSTLYTAPIAITADTTLKYVAFDPTGNVTTGQLVYTITNTPTPSAPTLTGAASSSAGTATVNWTAPDDAPSVPAVTEYTVTAYPTGGSASVDPVTAAGSVTTATFAGLAAGSTYQFAVTATNVNGTGPESAKSGTVTVQGAVVANAGPDQGVTRRTTAQTVQLTSAGSSTGPGTTYQWTRTGGQPVTLSSATSPNPTFSLPVYTAGTSNAPITFRLTVTNSSGSATDDVAINLVTDRVTIGTARWRSNDFRVTGSDTAIGNTVGIYVANADGTPGALVTGATGTTTAAAPPAIGGTYDIRVRTGVQNPVRVVAVSNLGGVSAPFTVST